MFIFTTVLLQSHQRVRYAMHLIGSRGDSKNLSYLYTQNILKQQSISRATVLLTLGLLEINQRYSY